MSVAFIIISVLILISCAVLVALVLMQKKNASGITAISGGASGADTYWDKNKGRTLEGQLEKYTKFVGAIFFILVFVSNFIK